MTDFLLLYGSREGQTRRIAEAIAEVLQEAGRSVELCSLDQPGIPDALARSARVVIGASIHYGHLPKALYALIAAESVALAARPNAFFCVNLTARKPGKDTPQGSAYMRTFLKRSTWQPQRLAVFAGALRYPQYTWYDRMMIRFIMWLTGGPTDPGQEVEFTDWQKIRQFAQTLLD